MLTCQPCDTSRLIINTPLLNGLFIDYKSKMVTRNGIELHLTKKEFSLLSLLVSVPGKVWSKSEILEKCWGISFDTGTNTVEVYASFLRSKCDKAFGTHNIATRAGFGYYWDNY